MLTASFVQFASGFRDDLDALGGLCRERGVFFFVDAIQGLGVFPLDVQKTPIDALAADGHKWLLGPEGAGIAYIRREWIERLHPVGVGAHSVVKPFDYGTIDFDLKPHAGRYEGGALNLPGVTALGESLDLLLGAGIDNVSARVLQLTDYLCEKAASAGLEVFSSRRPGDGSGIVSLTKPGRRPEGRDEAVPGRGRGGERPRRPAAGQPARLQHRRRDRPVPRRGEAIMSRGLSPRVAVYTGTFDPVHLGHVDVIQRGSRLFDRLIVGVGINPDKATLFDIDERVDLIAGGDGGVRQRGGAGVRGAGGAVRPRGRGRTDAPRAADAVRHGVRVHHVADEPATSTPRSRRCS